MTELAIEVRSPLNLVSNRNSNDRETDLFTSDWLRPDGTSGDGAGKADLHKCGWGEDL